MNRNKKYDLRRKQKMYKNKKVLYINNNKETQIDYMLSILLRSNGMYNWFYERFVNIGIVTPGEFLIEFTDIITSVYKNLLDYTVEGKYEDFNNMIDIKNLIVNRIENEQYISMWVDFFSIPISLNYGQTHFVHPVIIYGYDLNKNTFNLLFLDLNRGLVTGEINEQDLFYAYISIKEFNQYGGNTTTFTNTIMSYNIGLYYLNIDTYKFNMRNFLKELNSYLFSQYYYSQINVGISVYEELIKVMASKKFFIPFRSFYTIYMHKFIMNKRFDFINENFILSDTCLKYFEEYKKILLKTQNIFLMILKYNIHENKNLDILSEKIIDNLKYIHTKESELLSLIYNELITAEYREKEDKGLAIIPKYIKLPNDNLNLKLDKNEYIIGLGVVNSPNRTLRPILKSEISGEVYYIPDNMHSQNNEQILNIYPPMKRNMINISQIGKTNNDISSFKFNVYIPASIKIWDKHKLKKWKSVRNITKATFNNYMECDFYSNNPIICCEDAFINADIAKSIFINMKTEANSEACQIWVTTDNIMKNITCSVSPNDNYITYIFDLSSINIWRGVIKDIRFDPVHFDNTKKGGKFMINSIEISNRDPVYNNLKDYCKTQGINGWFYYSYNGDITYKELVWDQENNIWFSYNNPKLQIGKNFQSSANQFSAVRRWVCPAYGIYCIKIKILPLTQCKYSVFYIKKNFSTSIKIIKKIEKECTIKKKIVLKKGEYLSFEFLNTDELSVERIQIECDIIKISN